MVKVIALSMLVLSGCYYDNKPKVGDCYSIKTDVGVRVQTKVVKVGTYGANLEFENKALTYVSFKYFNEEDLIKMDCVNE